MRETAKGRPIPPEQTMRSAPPRLPTPIQALDLWARSLPPRTAMGEDYWAEELARMFEETRQHLYPLGDIPLIVLGSAKKDAPPPDRTGEEWNRLFEEKRRQRIAQAGLSRNGKVIFDPTSGHHIQLDDPELIVGAIREVVDEARRRRDGRP
jgi:hypothetical protein